jgi:hypothetical protein
LDNTTLVPLELIATLNGDGAICALIQNPSKTAVLYPIVRLDNWEDKAREYPNDKFLSRA